MYSSNKKNLLDYIPTIIGLGLIYKFWEFIKPTDTSLTPDNGKPPQKFSNIQLQRFDTDAKLKVLASKLQEEFYNFNSNEDNIVLWLKTIKSDADFSFLSKSFGTLRAPYTLLYMNLNEWLQSVLEPKDKLSINRNWETKKAISIRL